MKIYFEKKAIKMPIFTVNPTPKPLAFVGKLTLFRTLNKNPINGPVGYFWTPEHYQKKILSYVIMKIKN